MQNLGVWLSAHLWLLSPLLNMANLSQTTTLATSLSVTVEIKNLQYESCVEQRDEASGLFFK
jgi:hypothetical protein